MKKAIVTVGLAAMLSLGLTSCNKEQCWEITYTKGGQTLTEYVWCTREEKDVNIENRKKLPGITNVSAVKSSKAQSECAGLKL